MKLTLILIFTLGVVIGSLAYPSRDRSYRKSYSPQIVKTKVTLDEIQDLCETIVDNENLNNIFSDIIGLNITTLSKELDELTYKLVEVKQSRDDKISAILAKTSLNFKFQAVRLVQKFKLRLINFLLKGNMNTRQKISTAFVLKQSFNTFMRRLMDKVKTPDTVTKQEIVRIFEEFLDTKLTSTIREQFDDGKLILGIYFLFDDLNTEFLNLTKQESPEVQTELNNLYSEMEDSSMKIFKPLLNLVKPAILPPAEPELFDFPIFPTAGQEEIEPETQTSITELDNSEDNEIF